MLLAASPPRLGAPPQAPPEGGAPAPPLAVIRSRADTPGGAVAGVRDLDPEGVEFVAEPVALGPVAPLPGGPAGIEEFGRPGGQLVFGWRAGVAGQVLEAETEDAVPVAQQCGPFGGGDGV